MNNYNREFIAKIEHTKASMSAIIDTTTTLSVLELSVLFVNFETISDEELEQMLTDAAKMLNHVWIITGNFPQEKFETLKKAQDILQGDVHIAPAQGGMFVCACMPERGTVVYVGESHVWDQEVLTDRNLRIVETDSRQMYCNSNKNQFKQFLLDKVSYTTIWSSYKKVQQDRRRGEEWIMENGTDREKMALAERPMSKWSGFQDELR